MRNFSVSAAFLTVLFVSLPAYSALVLFEGPRPESQYLQNRWSVCFDGGFVCQKIDGGIYNGTQYWSIMRYTLGTEPDCGEGAGWNQQYNQNAVSGYCEDLCQPPDERINGICMTPQDQCNAGENPGRCNCELEGGNWFDAFSECLTPSPGECDSTSSDYQGTINDVPVCSGQSNCQPGETYGLVNGEATCIPADYGPPECEFDTIAVAEGGGGWTCATPEHAPDSDPAPDSDGDGTPDANDPDSNDTDGDGNPDSVGDDHDGDGVKNSNDPDYQSSYGDGATSQAVRENGAKLDSVNESLDDVNRQLQNANLRLTGIDDHLAELTDYVTSEPSFADTVLDGVPSIADTNQRLQAALFGHSTIGPLLTAPTIATNTSCPTYSMGATDYFPATTFSFHCTILEEHRTFISALMVGIWTLLAALWFLRA